MDTIALAQQLSSIGQLPLGPRHSDYTNKLASFREVEGIEQSTIQTAHEHPAATVVPLQTRLSLTEDADPDTVASRIEGCIDSPSIPALYPELTVHEAPKQIQTPAGEQSWQVDITWWWHPLANLLGHCLANADEVAGISFRWNPDPKNLSIGGISWMRVAPLDIGVSFKRGERPEQPEQFVRRCISPVVVSVEYHHHVADLRHINNTSMEGGEESIALVGNRDSFRLQFKERERQQTQDSRVKCGDAAEVATLIEDITGNRHPVKAQNTTDSRDDGTGIQLTVTSPPYVDAIDYDAYGTGDDWSGEEADKDGIKKWMEEQRRIFKKLYELTREGGYCAIVVSPIRSGPSTMTNLPAKFNRLMEDLGWDLQERITWDKTTSRDGNFGTTAQHPYPSYVHLNKQTETIQVWRKGDVVNRRDEDSRFELTELVTNEMANNVWHITPVDPNNDAVDHPCPFPEEIPHRFTLLYSNKGDIVADPMAGAGTTLKVADRLERTAVGMELRPQYVTEARSRLADEPYCRDDQQIAEFRTITPPQDEANMGQETQESSGSSTQVSLSELEG
jgi:DNA modification methylase